MVFRGGLGCHKLKKCGEPVKRLDRLATNLAHICRSIGIGYTTNKLPLETQGGGHLGGFRGQTFKSLEKLSNGWTDWHQLFNSSGSGHKYKSPHNTPGGILGGFRGSQIQKSGKVSNSSIDCHQLLVHVCGFVWEWTQLNTIHPQ